MLLTKSLLHLDHLRKSSSISIEQYVDGICSPRQYHRYLNGTSQITHDSFVRLCQKLNLTLTSFNFSFSSHGNTEFKEVFTMYSALCKFNAKEAERLYDKFKFHSFLNEEASRFFDFCKITHQLNTKVITKYTAYDQYSKLIDYKSYKDKTIYTFIDAITLCEIAHLELERKVFDAMQYLHEMLTDRKRRYVSSNTRYVLPQIYVRLCKLYGLNNEIEKSLDIAMEGIKYSQYVNDMSTLEYLFYYASLCHLKLNNIEEAIKYKTKCLNICEIKENKKVYDKFNAWINKDFANANIPID